MSEALAPKGPQPLLASPLRLTRGGAGAAMEVPSADRTAGRRNSLAGRGCPTGQDDSAASWGATGRTSTTNFGGDCAPQQACRMGIRAR